MSLPAQVAAVNALRDPDYYNARWAETHQLRAELLDALRLFKMEVVPGQANFLLAHLPTDGADAEALINRCRARGLFLRNATSMGQCFGDHAIRIAVKDVATTRRMLKIMTGEMNKD